MNDDVNAEHRQPAETHGIDMRPIDPHTGHRIGPLAQPGYYPGYSTLGQQRFWDAATRELVLDRVNNVPPFRWFNDEEARFWIAVTDRVIPQDDRDADHRIPVAPSIDKRLYEDKNVGYRFEDMPPDREAYKLGREAIERIADAAYHRSFVDLLPHEQEEILKSIHDGEPLPGADQIWERMPAHKFFQLVTKDCAEAYYAHPWAWDEVGFGGPAYPRAYMRLSGGMAEPWEVDERRYEWEAPPAARSDENEPLEESKHYGAVAGQAGSH